MGKEIQSKKRKSSVPDEGAAQLKKVKKLTSDAPTEKKRKASEESSPVAPKKSKKPKPVADDATAPAPKDTTTSKPSSDKASVETVSVKSPKASKDSAAATKKVKKSKKDNKAKPKKTKEEPVKAVSSRDDEDEEVESALEDDEGDSEVDDQTAALLEGFESDDDKESETEGGLREGKEVPKIPTLTNKNTKAMKRIAASGTPEQPGVVYVGHIPHGFYEQEMRAYFEQFGHILLLRLSRNRKTGASKHYAFIKFESASVADIVAKTMDNYLLFNHILKVKLIPEEQVPENLFKGANKRFKKVPWNKIAGRKLAQPAPEETWDKRIKKEEERRAEKAKKMKAIGYEFTAPEIKSKC